MAITRKTVDLRMAGSIDFFAHFVPILVAKKIFFLPAIFYSPSILCLYLRAGLTS